MSIHMSFSQLYTFYYVAQQGSMLKAAKILHVTPSAISLQIKKLEQWLGCRLFQRQKTALTLTKQGQQIFPLAESVFTQAKKLDIALQEIAQAQQNKIIIGVHMSPAHRLIPDLIRYINQRTPQYTVQMLIGTYEENIMRLRAHEIHLALIAGNPSGINDLDLYPFMEQKMAFVVCKDNPLGKHTPITIQDFATIPLVMQPMDSSFTATLHEYFLMHNITPNVVMNNIPDAVAKNLIQGSDFGVFLGSTIIQSDIKAGKIRTVDIKETFPPILLRFAALKSQYNTRQVRLFLELLPNQEEFESFRNKNI